MRAGDEAALDGVAVDVADDFKAGVLAGDVGVVVAVLPELFAVALKFAAACLKDFRNSARRIDGGSLMSRWTCSGMRT